MPLTYPYADGFLAQRVTQEREERAAADVAQLGTFPDAWVQRLVILRTYVLTCLEMQGAAEDLFTAKLASYRKEYTEALTSARAAQQAAEAAEGSPALGSSSPFSISLERA